MMDGSEGTKASMIEISRGMIHRSTKVIDPAISTFFVQLPHKLHNCLKLQLDKLAKRGEGLDLSNSFLGKDKRFSTALGIDVEKQMKTWRANPSWVDQAPNIKVSVPKGCLSNLKVSVDVGLPPDAVYDIVTDPDNKRVFKNIKEVISRKVLLDKGLRQVVEVEQAAYWRFLWWSGTISVHVIVDQNRADHSMKFRQVKTGFMKRFEGCWRVEPLFVDEKTCFPFKPKTWEEYCSCTKGKGRIGSRVELDQLIQPAIVPPPPISWYLRGITTKTTDMLINDLLAEAARLRRGSDNKESIEKLRLRTGINSQSQVDQICDIKDRWALRRRLSKKQHHKRRMLSS